MRSFGVSSAARALCGALAVLIGAGTLAACEDQSRQDPLLVRGSSNATVFAAAPVYVDRPLAENLTNSLAFADYRVLLERAGLLDTLRAPGPYTVFAVLDPSIDGIPQIYRDRMLDPANAAGLHQLMAYTIVPGRYTEADLYALARKGGGRASLPTLAGTPLTVALDPSGTTLELVDPAGRVSTFLLADVRQSNGLLYTGNRLLAPS